MSIVHVTILMFLLLFVGMIWGLDLAFLLGSIGVVFSIFLWGPHALGAITSMIFNWMTTYSIICVPMFVFMAFVLERSGIADALYAAMYYWVGRLPGGLAMGTVAICTVFGAMAGASSFAVATMGIIALPSMLKRKYDKGLAAGSIMAGAGLGALIPPSIIMILFALITGESIGRLFIGGIIPGLILSALFILYIGIRCALNPNLGPALPSGETISWGEKFRSLKSVILPVMLVASILGSIFFGIATPTEASAVGAIGAIISAAINRKLNWKIIKESCIRTLAICAMILWIVYGASAFAMTYQALGATKVITAVISGLEVNRWIILIFMQITFFFLGCILNNMAILMLTMPVYLPIIKILGFDPLWFGILYVINMEMGLMTPPFGFTLFYMKAVAPPEIKMVDLYRSIWPFVALQAICLALVMLFPQLAIWLPNKMISPVG
ncbi:TRAP transporter large permease subunit [Chloroflexota bacterium]